MINTHVYIQLTKNRMHLISNAAPIIPNTAKAINTSPIIIKKAGRVYHP